MNIIGENKISPLWLNAHKECSRDIEQEIKQFVLYKENHTRASGAETHWRLSLSPLEAKNIAVKIENSHPIGRLFDLDVMADSQIRTREEIGHAPRTCLICPLPAKECGIHRQEARIKSVELVRDFLARKISARSVRALLLEAALFPKPGLVTPFDNGSHKDMNFELLVKSAFALEEGFFNCARAGLVWERAVSDVLSSLREIGMEAEKKMYGATNGVNTHKGALFLHGLLCASLGILNAKTSEITAAQTAKTAGEIVAGIVGREANKKRGGSGARGEAESGFRLTLRALESLTEKFKTKKTREALIETLLWIISENTDTNIIARGGAAGLKLAQNAAKKILSPEGGNKMNAIRTMEKNFAEKNLSPGGSADILSATLFFL